MSLDGTVGARIKEFSFFHACLLPTPFIRYMHIKVNSD
jgi:hypothetical protein